MLTEIRNGYRKRRLEMVMETTPDFVIWPLWCGRVWLFEK